MDEIISKLGDARGAESSTRVGSGAGLVVAGNVTKKLDLLIVADPYSLSGKAQKARTYGTRIVAETAFWPMIGVEVD